MATAQTAPIGPHPRLWLDPQTTAGLKAQGASPDSPVARGAARCSAARTDPAEYSMGGWQGFEFVTTLSGCLVSWEATGNPDDLATAIKYWNVLLDDYQNVGDGAGGDDVVTHDTGYAMRTFAPYSAIAYDWLHDAPGVSEDLRAHARARFDAWVNYYSSSGYLRHQPGANYQAGYAFAATLIAIAEGGEAGAAGDAHWAIVRDTLWGEDLAPAFLPGGVLDGGDWPEGWQYGPLSVLELALAARALGDNGAPVAGVGPWADSLVLRFAHGLTPSTRKTFAAGDTHATTNHLNPTNGALLAAIAGPAGVSAKRWAREFVETLGLSNENPLFDALAAARTGEREAMPLSAPTSYLAEGVGNFYLRGAWTPDTVWSVFTCSRRQVDDHQHMDAGNWVMTRGADDVVVDPSPYGSLSSLTGNAPAVDSAVLPSGYSPSQGPWGQSTHLVWARQSASGIGVARCDYADQFRRSDVPSDVAHAVRDFVLVPSGGNGTAVLIDRVVTGDDARGLHLRVRSPAALALAGDTATGVVGASSLSIQNVWATSGAPTVRDMPRSPECSSRNRGTCDISRLPSGQEYRLDVSGPNAAAITVVDAQPAGAAPPANQLLSGAGYRGVLLGQPEPPVAVIVDDGVDAVAQASFTYRVPAGAGATHVVVDAPMDENGESDVTTWSDGTDCVVTVAPHAGATPGLDGRGLVMRLDETCAAREEAAVPPSDPDGTGDAGGAPPTGVGHGGGADGGSLPDAAGGSGAGAFNAAGGWVGAGAMADRTTWDAAGSATSMDGGSDANTDASSPRPSGCAFVHRRGGEYFAVMGIGALGLLLQGRRRRRAGVTGADGQPHRAPRPRIVASRRRRCSRRDTPSN